MAMLNSEKDKIIKLCNRMVGNVPFSVYEEGTFDIKSMIYCFKTDENGFCTVSDEPIKNRLVAAALIFKNFTHSQVAINFNNDLDEVTHDVFAIVKEMLENLGIKCIDFGSIENDAEHPCYTLQYLTETGIDEITGEEDITQLIANIDEYFDVSADFDDIVGAISIRYGFNDATLDNCAAFFFPSARLSDDNLEEIQEFIRYSGLTSSYLGPNIFVSNAEYLPEHKPGLFFLISWGCPPSYYDNHIGVDSIDFFALVSCLLYIKKYCDNKSKGNISMEQTSYYDILRRHIEDNQIELGYSFTFSDFFYVLDRLSVLSCVSKLRNKEILSNNPGFNYVFDYSWNKFDSFLCENNKHQLLLDISAAYGWDLIADETEVIVLNALSMFITIDCLSELISSNRTNSQYSELYSIWEMPVEERFQACYETCDDSYCEFNMYEYYPSKAFIKDNLRSETMEYAKKVLFSYYNISVSDEVMLKLLSMDLITWLSSVTILHTKIRNPEFSPSDTFFEELNYFNAFDIYNVSPMFTCNDDAYLILTFPEFDDTEYRISDTVDYGYLNPDGFRLFNNFYLNNKN